METAEPVSYEFPGHAVGAVAPRRMMGSNVGHNFPFYTNPTGGYTLPFHQSSSPAYSFGHTLNHHHHHHHHHPGYQHYFVAGQQPINPQPVRLSSEPPSIQQIPDIRPAKNAVNRVARDPLMKIEHNGGSQQPPGAQSSSNEAGAQGKGSSSNEVEFSTEVDILMKAIQAKVTTPSPGVQSLPPLQQLTHGGSNGYPQSYSMPVTNPRCTVMVEEAPSRSGKKRKYACTLPQCGKSFAQKTHLDIHMRAHTGDKPFVCKEPSCGQRFSQLGNLKSHQNKFHATTLRNLTIKFSQVTEGDHMSPQDRKLWEYFATLYKNSNKGIKGRGKDRRISPTSRSDPGSESRRRIQPLNGNDDKMRRASYEDTSMYNGGSSSDDDDAEPYYIERQAH
ncbi:hypothetical protein AbraIFM66951_004552 [Aspergillus brasiliensis]|uniref:C2H2-type domain-containing protein n=1 Tax=Aspergillus brasiliensis TaxID=319629 RepID=A0A9W5Z2M7_9EURO|nr:hypothetical protein AbraCBS73388_003784 [Aspergillus brasiliensis]GKZ50860.1 hypothetical protein AbraIFM66951_004552 [Aspergillus brasiliensis]